MGLLNQIANSVASHSQGPNMVSAGLNNAATGYRDDESFLIARARQQLADLQRQRAAATDLGTAYTLEAGIRGVQDLLNEHQAYLDGSRIGAPVSAPLRGF